MIDWEQLLSKVGSFVMLVLITIQSASIAAENDRILFAQFGEYLWRGIPVIAKYAGNETCAIYEEVWAGEPSRPIGYRRIGRTACSELALRKRASSIE